jgi:hypothetical protein
MGLDIPGEALPDWPINERWELSGFQYSSNHSVVYVATTTACRGAQDGSMWIRFPKSGWGTIGCEVDWQPLQLPSKGPYDQYQIRKSAGLDRLH